MIAAGLAFSLGLLLAGGLLAWICSGRPALAAGLGSASACAAGALGLAASLAALHPANAFSLSWPWVMPDAALSLGADPLAAFFLAALFAVSGCAALFGWGYLRQDHGASRLGSHWFFFNLLVASMAVVLLARNALLFLVAWEVMTVSSYFLVVHEHEEERVRRAGWIYLTASHIGVLFLLGFFALAGQQAGGFEFSRLQGALPGSAGWLFLLALAGFGLKAGFVPLHVWLPEAHPAAPSHVSALLSGVMIKLGIYGLFRVLPFFAQPAGWWGGLLIGIGLLSGVCGVAFALAQHDLKRLLAYHSVENIGIIALGLGLALAGRSLNLPALAALGALGALLHVWNHALFKALLFLGAGAVVRQTGLRSVDAAGGLLKRMPVTGAAFFVGAAAICGLPPFNGLVSEWLIYAAGFTGITQAPAAWAPAAIAAVAGLAAIGGLALACFTKVFGAVFLGEPRTAEAAAAAEAPWTLLAPMLALAAACLAIGLAGPWLCLALRPAALSVLGAEAGPGAASVALAAGWLLRLTGALAMLLAATALLVWLRNRRLRKPVASGPTWDCGYAEPSPRMQYTAASFSQPLTRSLGLLIRPQTDAQLPAGLFPGQARWQTHVSDLFQRLLLEPLFRGAAAGLSWLRWLQHGRVQLYVLYIAAALILLALWGWL